MPIREPQRWRTAFGRWVGRVGVPQVVRHLHAERQTVTPTAVYQWLSGDRVPRPDRAAAMVRGSGGQISLDDVYRHREEIRRN